MQTFSSKVTSSPVMSPTRRGPRMAPTVDRILTMAEMTATEFGAMSNLLTMYPDKYRPPNAMAVMKHTTATVVLQSE